MIHIFEPPKYTLIYVFRITDERHAGCLKIGETSLDKSVEDIYSIKPNAEILQEAAKNRINSYTQTAGIAYELLYTEMAVFKKGNAVGCFNDKDVHEVLRNSGIKAREFEGMEKQGREWFDVDLETVKCAIAAVKDGRSALQAGEVSIRRSPIIFRPEQRYAIDKTITRFKRYNAMLWNAKMRFGKTLCALQVVKEMGFGKTIIVTHEPVVEDGWFDDFGKIFYDSPNYVYGSREKGESMDNLVKGDKSYVYFASMQDLRGSKIVGGKFEKNKEVFANDWDLLIVDEAHEGTLTELGDKVLLKLTKEKTKTLKLSGTPFNLLDDYNNDEIFTWDYVMEQKAKADWDKNHMGDHNPYAGLPAMNIYTYDLGRLLPDFADKEIAFNFREFFRTNDDGEFVHQTAVHNLLDLLTEESEKSYYPFANETFRNIFRHTFWVLPGVKEAKALSAMLKAHKTFKYFDIVNVAGEGDEDEESYRKALEKVNDAIGSNPDETRTITLTCDRLRTGITIKPWTAVFMLSGSYNTSASSYMQTIFRVQTPFTCNGRMKDNCYVFDFAPDRTLQVLANAAKVSGEPGKTTEEERKQLGDFLNFCPVISIEGSEMNKINEQHLFQQLKKVYIERVVNNGFEDGYLYNDELLKLTGAEWKDFEDLKGIIGQTKALGKTATIDVNAQGLTNEEYEEKEALEKKKKKELTEEEKARLEELKKNRKQRDNAISILRGISIRMPLMIYGAEIADEEKELNITNFASLIDDASWAEFMPKNVTKVLFAKFIKYYDPDIFAAAARRIREITRAADKLTIEERIERITNIFSHFRNPDKETVLTPWRVVNMHIGDTLGGYNFFDEKYSEQLSEPRYIDNGDVTHNVFDDYNTRILEINSKTGLYPLYMTYSVFRSITEHAFKASGLIEERIRVTDEKSLKARMEQDEVMWRDVLQNNIFVICRTKMAASITRRTLAGFRKDVRMNVRYYEYEVEIKDLVAAGVIKAKSEGITKEGKTYLLNGKATKRCDMIDVLRARPDLFQADVVRGRDFWNVYKQIPTNEQEDINNMKFNAIIGNPPYQIMDGGAGASSVPIYNQFVNVSINLLPSYVSMIMPSRWMSGGRGLDEFRSKLINDKRIRFMHDYYDASVCFSNVEINPKMSLENSLLQKISLQPFKPHTVVQNHSFAPKLL